jgi:RimJ/RimL family protein N-acetyltransferase
VTDPSRKTPKLSSSPSSDAWRALNSRAIRSPRLRLRLLREDDGRFLAKAYRRNREWLEPWDPVRPESFFSAEFQERSAQAARREAVNDRGYRFLAFERGEAESQESFAGMAAVANIVRGVFQCATLGYWIAGAKAGQGLGRLALRYLKIAGEWRDHDIFAKTAEEHDPGARQPWRENWTSA